MIMTTIKTNSSHLVSTYVSGTGLCTLHTNPMKYEDRLRFMRRKLRQGRLKMWPRDAQLAGLRPRTSALGVWGCTESLEWVPSPCGNRSPVKCASSVHRQGKLRQGYCSRPHRESRQGQDRNSFGLVLVGSQWCPQKEVQPKVSAPGYS